MEKLNAKEFCKYVGICLTTYYELKANGELPPVYRPGKRDYYLIPDVKDWMKSRKVSHGTVSEIQRRRLQAQRQRHSLPTGLHKNYGDKISQSG